MASTFTGAQALTIYTLALGITGGLAQIILTRKLSEKRASQGSVIGATIAGVAAILLITTLIKVSEEDAQMA